MIDTRNSLAPGYAAARNTDLVDVFFGPMCDSADRSADSPQELRKQARPGGV